MKVGLKGHYRVTKNKPGEDEATVTEFNNLITDYGLNRLLSGSSFSSSVANCVVGTGVTEPSVTNLNITAAHKQAAQVSLQATAGPLEDLPALERTITFKYVFNPGVITSTVTEIGTKDNNAALNNNTLFSHSLIKDTNGNPTTLTVLPDEYLNVYYSLTFKFPDKGTWVSLTKDIGGVPTTIRMKMINILRTGLTATSFTEMCGFSYINFRAYNTGAAIMTADEETYVNPQSAAVWTLESYDSRHGITCSRTISSENGVFTRRARIKFTPQSGGRIFGTMSLMSNNSSSPMYVIEATPPISKTDEQEFNLDLDFSLSRL